MCDAEAWKSSFPACLEAGATQQEVGFEKHSCSVSVWFSATALRATSSKDDSAGDNNREDGSRCSGAQLGHSIIRQPCYFT